VKWWQHQGVTPDDDLADPGTVFAALARVIYASAAMNDVLQAVAEMAPRLVTGCDHASVMMRQGSRFVTVAASDDVARTIDALERSMMDGPCVDAIEDERVQLDADLTDRPQWPTLAQAVLASTPVRGVAGYRLLIDGRKAGALNVFSDRAGALTESSTDQGAVLAAFASVALMATSSQQRAETLQQGLSSNREIGKAVGLLMAAHGITAEEAFRRLRRTSSNMNLKVAEVARQIVQRHETG